MITRAKLSVVRVNSFVVEEQFATFSQFFPDAVLIRGGAYLSKYGNVKLHNSSALGLATSGNMSGIFVAQRCDGSFFSILLFAFCAVKGPAKELTLPFMLGEKHVNKIFLLFPGSESAEVSPN